MADIDPGFWQTFGGGGLTALIVAGAASLTRRQSRLTRLEKAVEECRRRDAQVVVLAAGFRLVVGALSREVPHAPELRMCRDLLARHLPITRADTDLACFADVLEALDQIQEPTP